MKSPPFSNLAAFAALALFFPTAGPAADVEMTKVEQVTMSHSLDWVRGKFGDSKSESWDSVLDEIEWGTPAEGKRAVQNCVGRAQSEMDIGLNDRPPYFS